MTVTLDDVRAAAARTAGRVRRTPILRARPLRDWPHDGELVLKLECLQAIGSFKARGATNKLLTLDAAAVARGLVTASGGNHGLGVAYAAWQAKAPARIYLPTSTPAAKADKLRAWGAEVVLHGAVWDEANDAATAAAEREGLTYVHPFADPAVIAGQGTTALELLEDAPELDAILVAIGGGGLIAGAALAAKALKPSIRIVGVEPIGAPTLKESLAAGGLVTLDRIETEAGTLAPRRSAELNLALIRRYVDEIVLVSDDDMRRAARWLWFECGLAAELSGAAAVAALLVRAWAPPAGATVGALVCGAGADGLA
jgi:threonine dehydratase